MKMVLADLASECFDESIELGEYNEMTASIQRRVLARIKDDQRRKHFAVRQTLSIVLIAAVLVSLLTVTAYALGFFKLNTTLLRAEDEHPHGRWIERDGRGQIIDIQDMDYPDTNLVFTFDGEATPHYIEFKPGWLPMNPDMWAREPENWENLWYTHLGCDGGTAIGHIHYLIDVFYAVPDFQFVMMYQSEIVEETTWGDYEITKLVNHNPYWGDGHTDDNYVMVFSPEHGYMIRIGGGLDMETLEKIAQNLEVRILDKEVIADPDYNIGCLNIGRG